MLVLFPLLLLTIPIVASNYSVASQRYHIFPFLILCIPLAAVTNSLDLNGESLLFTNNCTLCASTHS